MWVPSGLWPVQENLGCLELLPNYPGLDTPLNQVELKI
jgi:hypothetical protein